MSEEKKPVKPNKIPVWHSQQELILKNWSEIGSSYRYLHDKSYMKYNSQNLRFALPVIVISTITGTANFAQKSFPEDWAAYVPLAIGFLNLTAGLITTIAQFLRVSELLEGHRAASISYSKFSRNISVELSLPVSQRTSDGYDFIVKCRSELDRLIEQSPNIPSSLVNDFANKFKETAFFKPDILDITPVVIYKNDEEAEQQRRKIILQQAKNEREAILKEEESKRQAILNEFKEDQNNKNLELSKKLSQLQNQKKETINITSVSDSMDKLLKDLDNTNGHMSNTSPSKLSGKLNDLINPQMSNKKLTRVITDKLNIDDAYSPSSSDLDDEEHPVHSNNSDSPSVQIDIKGEGVIVNDTLNDSVINNTTQDLSINDTPLLENEGSNNSIEDGPAPLSVLDKINLKKQKRDNKFYYFDFKKKLVYNTKYILVGTLDDNGKIDFN
tara:strand:- start:17955 stop:19283 length:1329 start_codon:yes stop_codon:yes gene_type:complete